MKIEKFLCTYPVWSAYKLHERLVVPMQRLIKQQELTFLQSLIMAALYFEDAPTSPSELVGVFGTSLPNISHSLKHLRELGLVERTVDSGDSRRVRFVLTTNAQASLKQIIKMHDMAQEVFEQSLSQQEIAEWCERAERISLTKW